MEEKRPEHEFYVYRNYLYPLSELEDFEVADGQPDVRGWSVMGNDGNKFGEVHELIVDIKANKVRYLDVNIREDVFGEDEGDRELEHILIPIGVAILNHDDGNVIVPPISMNNLRNYPFYRREPIYVLRDYERSVRDFFAGNARSDRRYDPEFYNDAYYKDDNFMR